MENIILGLLMLKSRTIYELRKRIDEGLNLMYSCSTGSIQAAIKKLLKRGYICVEEISENGRLKKLYRITAEGQAQFNMWVNGAIKDDTPKNPELAKIYFMGLSEEEIRIPLIEKYIEDLRKNLCELQLICDEGDRVSAEFERNDVFFYQLQTAKYGRDLMLFNIAWYENLLKTVRERKE